MQGTRIILIAEQNLEPTFKFHVENTCSNFQAD
jgi:hypothetical protein